MGIRAGLREPWEMTREEFSVWEYEPDRSETKQLCAVREALQEAGVEVLDIGIKGSRRFGVDRSGSDYDVFVKVSDEDFGLADDVGASLSRRGIDVMVNWSGAGKPGGILRGEKTHRRIVRRAIAEGKPVPPKVREEFLEEERRRGDERAAKLRKALVGLVGAEKREELEEALRWQRLLRSVLPTKDQEAKINAIRALLETAEEE